MNRTEALEQLGKRVREEQDASFDEPRVLLTARRRWLVGGARATPKRSLGIHEVLAYGVLGGVLGVALVGGHFWLTRPLSYDTDQLQVRVEGARSVVRAQKREGAIRFSDGTTVWLDKGAEAELSNVDQDGATVAVTRGGVRAEVEHRIDSRWRFRFGPFGVRVTGTEFSGDWEDETENFNLTLTEGSVDVSGCGLVQPITVKAGQSVMGTCSGGRAALRFMSAPAPADAAKVEDKNADVVPSLSTSTSSAARTGGHDERPALQPADAGPTKPAWDELAKTGRFADAYAIVDKAGFEHTCDAADSATLLRLADVAMFAGRMDRSQYALMLVRSRHGGSRASAAAAFKLGRMAFDQGGSVATAGTWFRTYLAEAPGGAFAREARGRLLEVEKATGNVEAARQRASEYLERYPSGPHAALARSILAK